MEALADGVDVLPTAVPEVAADPPLSLVVDASSPREDDGAEPAVARLFELAAIGSFRFDPSVRIRRPELVMDK